MATFYPAPNDQVGTHPNDADYMGSDAQILQRIADIRKNRGLPPDPGSDRVWLRRIKSGGPTVFGDARTAINDKALEVQRAEDLKNSTPEGPGKSPTPDTGKAPTDPSPALDYREFAPPWMKGAMLETFVDTWASTGDPSLAMAKVRRSSAYDAYFVGNKREDGSLRYDENTYLATRDSFGQTMSEYGLGGIDKSMIEQLFTGDVSAQEFVRGIDAGFNSLVEPGTQPGALMQEYIKGFVGTGSAQVGMEKARESSAYDAVFAGNRREDGSLRMAEQDYFAYKRGWSRSLAGFGLNPGEFMARGRFEAAVRGEVSIEELNMRLQATQDGILDNVAGVQQYYAENYGLELTPEAILGMAIDPTVQRDVLERRITAGQIGGEAAVRGFIRDVDRAEELARAGVTQEAARNLYGQAEATLGGISATTQRFNRGATSIGQFEEAAALGDEVGMKRLQTALGEEQASFGSRADTRRSREGFGLTGLRER